MKKYTLNIIRKAFFTLCLMASVTMAWAVDVTDETSLRTALSGVEQNLTLTQDIALTSTLEINRAVTLDLNGYTISADGFRAIHVTTGANVLITSDKPSAITVSGSIADNSSVIRLGKNEGDPINISLTIDENITIYTDKCYGISVFGNATTETLVVKGTISTTDVPAISGNGSAGYGNTTIKIEPTARIITTNEVAIYHPQSGTLTVNGTVTGAGGIEMKGGSLVVGTDAHITATAQPSQTPNNDGTSTRGYAVAIVESNGGYAGVSTINISAEAEIDGPVAMLVDSELTGVTPPTFDPDGVQMNVSVTKDGNVKQYSSLLDAVNEAPTGATIQLLNDVAITEAAVIDKNNITIDLNGKNITVTGDRAFWVKNPGASITGTGTISATGIVNPDWSVIQVGNEAEDASLTIGDGVTITTNDCYGITTIGTGTSTLTVNGKVNTTVRPAVVSTNNFTTTIGTTAVITTTNEVAVYATGGALTVQGEVTGLTAVETKGGTLTIDGATLKATGTPSHTANNNGTSTRGYAVAMVKNDNFPDITAATFSGTNIINHPVATLIDSGTDTDPTFTGITMLADINGEHYSSVIDASNIVPSDGTVKLMDNLALTAPLEFDRHASYKLDLDGHNITTTDCNAITLKSGDVIITNTGAAATISSIGTVAATDAVIRLGDNSGENRNISLGIDENITVSTTVCQGILLSGTNTREALTVKGTISTDGQPAIAGDKANGGTTINIEENASVTSLNNVAIYHPQTGTLTVEGAEGHNAVVSGTTGIEMKAGDLIVGEHATIIGSVGSATHTANDASPSTSGYGIAIVENANFEGVGNVDIETTEHITAPVSVAMLVDSKHSGVAEPEFIGNIMLVAEVTGTNTDKYAKLEDAINQAQATNTVKMLEDANIASQLVIGKNITFDINDYTITSTATSGYAITSSANTTIQNGGIVTTSTCGGIQATAGSLTLQKMNVRTSGNSLNLADATATLDATSILTSTTNETVAMGNGATLTVDGKIYNTTTNAIAATGTATALTINAGAIVSTAAGNAVDWQATGTLTVSGGKINGTTNAVYANNGIVDISGGTFTGTADALTVVNEAASDCTISIEHGTFNCGSGAPIVSSGTNAAKNFVKGDYFSKQIPQDFCYEGYMISSGTNSNGMYYLVSELVITDATNWTKPTTAYTIHTAKYVRNSGMGTAKFGTLCLPFSFTPGDSKTTIPTEMKFYSVNRIAGNTLYLDELSGTIAAGTPVIFQRTGSETTFTITCEDANIPVVIPTESNGLVGTFTTVDITADLTTKYYLNGDMFHQADQSITVPAFRAYINNPSVSAPPRLTIQTESMETGLEDSAMNQDAFFSAESIEAVYDLQGRKLDALQQGVNIVKTQNGKTIKVFLRGEL